MSDQKIEHAQQTSPKKRIATDHRDQIYELTGMVGQGGQGAVCTTTYPNVLVKIFTGEGDEKREEWLRQVRWIMKQPLEGLNLARPLAVIDKPRPGYVMELMDGLVPLSSLYEDAAESLLSGGNLDGFLATGGLRRRSRLLARLARLLADLHARGLVFGDLSPSNVFVSHSVDHAEVWLIDCDNLCVRSRQSQLSVFTPDYGAPEIVIGDSGVNTLTDSWSFGVLAFQLLTMGHPLKGDLVNDGDPEIEKQALCGELPWVDHKMDCRNSLSTALDRELVLTEGLRKLFDQCFCEGMVDPGSRPSMAAWAAALESAENLCITCDAGDCGNSFFAETNLICPFCDHRQLKKNHLRFGHYLYAPELMEVEGSKESDVWIKTDDFLHLVIDSSLEFRKSPIGTEFYQKSEPLCRVELSGEGLLFAPLSSVPVFVQRVEDGKALKLTRPQRLSNGLRREERIMLHFGDLESGHSAWSFRW